VFICRLLGYGKDELMIELNNVTSMAKEDYKYLYGGGSVRQVQQVYMS